MPKVPLSSVQKLKWYAHRLSGMSPLEIVHRLEEQAKRAHSRYTRKGWSKFDVGDGLLCTLPAFARVIEQPWTDELTSILDKSAKAFVDQRITLLGREWPSAQDQKFQNKSYWHIDPVTGTFWPGADRFCFDVNYRHDASKGDVKFVWELNRLQFLQPAALMAAKKKNPQLSRKVLETVLSWMEANPPLTGVNWSSGIEIALRLVSLAVIVSVTDRDLIDEFTRRRLRAFVAAHAYWLARFPSLFSSANNHRVAEGLGLVIASALAPDLPEASKYQSEGASIIRDAPMSQFFSDGVGAEQSPTYSAFTLEMIAVAHAVMSPHARDPSPRQQLVNAAFHLSSMLDQNGVCPRIGDDDEGRVLAISPIREERYVASITAALAGQLDEPRLCPERRDAHWRDLLFSAPVTGAPPQDGIITFPEGGYTIARETINNRNILLVFDHGPLGFLSIAAHGHADALAIWLHVDGVPIFVDAGTYLYHSGGVWRDHFRSTGCHNTLEIAGHSQSLTAGSFNWKHKAKAWLEDKKNEPPWSITARHDGYSTRFGVQHERTLRRTGSGFMIVDQLDGDLEQIHSAKQKFLVNPSLQIKREGHGIVILQDEKPLVRVTSPSCGDMQISMGRAEGDAFYSPAFGAKVPASAISIAPTVASSEIVTHIEIAPGLKGYSSNARHRALDTSSYAR
jgi:hypothetical protein